MPVFDQGRQPKRPSLPAGLTQRSRRFVYLLLLLAVLMSSAVIGNDIFGDPNHLETVLSVALLGVLAVVLHSVRRHADASFAVERQMTAILEAIPVPMAVLDAQGTVRMVNDPAEEMFGWSAEEVVGGTARAVPAENPEQVARIQAAALRGERLSGVEVRLLDRAGNAREIEAYTAPTYGRRGKLDAIVACWLDVSERNRTVRQLELLATHDSLTELPNRRVFDESFSRTVARAERGHPAMLFMIDCDNLKFVNDTAGHSAGDHVLMAVSAALRDALRPGDLLARIGGDEFAALVFDVSREDAAELARRLVASVGSIRLDEGGHVLDPTVSIGVSVIDRDSTETDALWKADSALFAAKDLGRNRVLLAEDERVVEVALGGRWAGALKDALLGEGFVLLAQPILRLEDGRTEFYELLIRLKDTEGSLILPHRFLPAAERMGLMPRIDAWVVDEALSYLAENDDVRLLVNISSISLSDESFMDRLGAKMEASRDAARIGFEITETAALSNATTAVEQLRALKALGCVIALDDFGNGFSSFTRLKTLPVDLLKVDRTLTGDLLTAPSSYAIMSGVCTLAQAIGAKIVVEAVETEEIVPSLRTLEIDYAQGFYFGRPVNLDSLSTRLSRHHRTWAAL